MATRFYFVELAKRDSRFNRYSKDLEKFLTYLLYTKKTKFQLTLFTPDLKIDRVILDYFNRYSERYFKALYARLIKFQDKYIAEKKCLTYVYMLTLTIPQKNKTIYQCLEDLRTYRKTIFQYLRNERKKHLSIEWLWFTEPHKSAYPHCHIMILSDKADFMKHEKKIKTLWHDVAGANYLHGAHLEYIGIVNSCMSSSDTCNNNNVDDGGAVAVGAVAACDASACADSVPIANVVQYIIKYMSKSLMSSVDLPTLIFHSQVAKFYHPNPRYRGTGSGAYRLWGYSAGLSPYLQKTKKEPVEGLNVLSFGYAGEDSKIFYQTYNDNLFFSILKRHSKENLIKNTVIED